jgi:hypothetical protein
MAGVTRASAALLVVFLLAASSEAKGQTVGPVRLELRPNPGDTLRLRLDQTIEVTRTTRQSDDDVLPADVASLVMLARIAVESADLEGTTVTALTDSVRITSSEAYAQSGVLRSAQAMQGTRFRFRVAADGSTHMNAPGGLAEVGTLFSQLPATLPTEALAPGASWTRVMEIPLPATPDGRPTATLNSTFHFDSLSRSGEFAHLSVRGRLLRSGALPGGTGRYVQTSGDVSGTILIDRRRGWISEARTVVTLRSLVSTRNNTAPPVRVRVKITQWMRVL